MPKDKTTPQRPAGSKRSASPNMSRTEQRQKERRAEERRQRLIYAAIVIVAVVVVGAVVLLFSNAPADAPIPETVSRYDGISQVMTEKGYPRLGSLDGISVTLYTAFACDACRDFQKNVMPALIERVRAGDISLTFVPLRGGTIANPNGATRSALCAGQQGKFFQYADALYQWLEDFGGDAFRDNRLTTGASNLGLDQGQFNGCRSSAPENTVYNAATVDLTGTSAAAAPPLVRVNNITLESIDLVEINAAIDSALEFRSGSATEEPTEEPADEPTEAPTASPTEDATSAPTDEPTEAATVEATDAPAATAAP